MNENPESSLSALPPRNRLLAVVTMLGAFAVQYADTFTDCERKRMPATSDVKDEFVAPVKSVFTDIQPDLCSKSPRSIRSLRGNIPLGTKVLIAVKDNDGDKVEEMWVQEDGACLHVGNRVFQCHVTLSNKEYVIIIKKIAITLNEEGVPHIHMSANLRNPPLYLSLVGNPSQTVSYPLYEFCRQTDLALQEGQTSFQDAEAGVLAYIYEVTHAKEARK